MHSPSIAGRIPGLLDAFGRGKHGIHHGVPRKSMLTSRVLQESRAQALGVGKEQVDGVR